MGADASAPAMVACATAMPLEEDPHFSDLPRKRVLDLGLGFPIDGSGAPAIVSPGANNPSTQFR